VDETNIEISHFYNFSDLHDLDLGSGHTAYRRVSLIDFYQISSASKKLRVDH